MVDLALLQSVSYIAGALGVCVAAIYYMMNLRLSQRNQQLSLDNQMHTLAARQTKLTMQLHNAMRSKEYLDAFQEIESVWRWENYDDFMNKYGPEKAPSKWAIFATVCGSWEQAGILVKHKALDPEMLYDQWGSYYTDFWERIEPLTIEHNVRSGGGFLEYAEDLYYYFEEARLRDHLVFKEREAERLRKRGELRLNTRPAYTGDWKPIRDRFGGVNPLASTSL